MVDKWFIKDPFSYGMWKAQQAVEEAEAKRKYQEAMESLQSKTFKRTRPNFVDGKMGFDFGREGGDETRFWFDEMAGFKTAQEAYGSSTAREETATEKNKREQAWRDMMDTLRKATDEMHKQQWKFHDKAQESFYRTGYEQHRNSYANQAGTPIEDCFKILGLTQPCNEQDIKSAFKKLAFKHHPDTGGSKEAFQRINSAKMEALRRIR